MQFIGIVGSRRRNSYEDYRKLIQSLNGIYVSGDWFVSGGCSQGADDFAERIARIWTVPIYIMRADWDRHGKTAGPIRNLMIAQHVDTLIALPHSDRTGGTESTIYQANLLKKKVILV